MGRVVSYELFGTNRPLICTNAINSDNFFIKEKTGFPQSQDREPDFENRPRAYEDLLRDYDNCPRAYEDLSPNYDK
jgi:hypothetical protein